MLAKLKKCQVIQYQRQITTKVAALGVAAEYASSFGINLYLFVSALCPAVLGVVGPPVIGGNKTRADEITMEPDLLSAAQFITRKRKIRFFSKGGLKR